MKRERWGFYWPCIMTHTRVEQKSAPKFLLIGSTRWQVRILILLMSYKNSEQSWLWSSFHIEDLEDELELYGLNEEKSSSNISWGYEIKHLNEMFEAWDDADKAEVPRDDENHGRPEATCGLTEKREFLSATVKKNTTSKLVLGKTGETNEIQLASNAETQLLERISSSGIIDLCSSIDSTQIWSTSRGGTWRITCSGKFRRRLGKGSLKQSAESHVQYNRIKWIEN